MMTDDDDHRPPTRLEIMEQIARLVRLRSNPLNEAADFDATFDALLEVLHGVTLFGLREAINRILQGSLGTDRAPSFTRLRIEINKVMDESGPVTPLRLLAGMSYEEYLQSPEWQETRKAALKRADHHCQLCRSPNELDVHHNTYERLRYERPADLVVLCRECHDIFHKTRRLHQPQQNRGPQLSPLGWPMLDDSRVDWIERFQGKESRPIRPRWEVDR